MLFMKNKTIERRPVFILQERVVLTAKGNLNFCPTDWFGQAIYVNYNETTIKDLWNSLFYNKLRNKHMCNNI